MEMQLDQASIKQAVSSLHQLQQRAYDLAGKANNSPLSGSFSAVSGLDQLGASFGNVMVGGSGSAHQVLRSYSAQVEWLMETLKSSYTALTGQNTFNTRGLELSDEGGTVTYDRAVFPVRPEPQFHDFEFRIPHVAGAISIAGLLSALSSTRIDAARTAAHTWSEWATALADIGLELQKVADLLAENNVGVVIDKAVEKIREMANLASYFEYNARILADDLNRLATYVDGLARHVEGVADFLGSLPVEQRPEQEKAYLDNANTSLAESVPALVAGTRNLMGPPISVGTTGGEVELGMDNATSRSAAHAPEMTSSTAGASAPTAGPPPTFANFEKGMGTLSGIDSGALRTHQASAGLLAPSAPSGAASTMPGFGSPGSSLAGAGASKPSFSIPGFGGIGTLPPGSAGSRDRSARNGGSNNGWHQSGDSSRNRSTNGSNHGTGWSGGRSGTGNAPSLNAPRPLPRGSSSPKSFGAGSDASGLLGAGRNYKPPSYSGLQTPKVGATGPSGHQGLGAPGMAGVPLPGHAPGVGGFRNVPGASGPVGGSHGLGKIGGIGSGAPGYSGSSGTRGGTNALGKIGTIGSGAPGYLGSNTQRGGAGSGVPVYSGGSNSLGKIGGVVGGVPGYAGGSGVRGGAGGIGTIGAVGSGALGYSGSSSLRGGTGGIGKIGGVGSGVPGYAGSGPRGGAGSFGKTGGLGGGISGYSGGAGLRGGAGGFGSGEAGAASLGIGSMRGGGAGSHVGIGGAGGVGGISGSGSAGAGLRGAEGRLAGGPVGGGASATGTGSGGGARAGVMGGIPMGAAGAGEKKKGKVNRITSSFEEEGNVHDLIGDKEPVVPGVIGEWVRD